MNTTNKEIKEKEERLLSFSQEIEGLRDISDAEEYAKQLARLFLGNGLSLKTILLMAIDFGQQHPNWISVEERLPEKEKDNPSLSVDVIVTDGCSRFETYYNFKFRIWVGAHIYGTITHWMPLPQPPRKEE